MVHHLIEENRSSAFLVWMAFCLCGQERTVVAYHQVLVIDTLRLPRGSVLYYENRGTVLAAEEVMREWGITPISDLLDVALEKAEKKRRQVRRRRKSPASQHTTSP